jgi:hypothetical protein
VARRSNGSKKNTPKHTKQLLASLLFPHFLHPYSSAKSLQSTSATYAAPISGISKTADGTRNSLLSPLGLETALKTSNPSSARFLKTADQALAPSPHTLANVMAFPTLHKSLLSPATTQAPCSPCHFVLQTLLSRWARQLHSSCQPNNTSPTRHTISSTIPQQQEITCSCYATRTAA